MAVFKIYAYGHGLPRTNARNSIEFIRNVCTIQMYPSINRTTQRGFMEYGVFYPESDMDRESIEYNNANYLPHLKKTVKESLTIETNDGREFEFKMYKTPKGCNVFINYQGEGIGKYDSILRGLEHHITFVSLLEAVKKYWLPDLTIIDHAHYHISKKRLTNEQRDEMAREHSETQDQNLVERVMYAKHHDINDLCKRIGLDTRQIYTTPELDGTQRMTIIKARANSIQKPTWLHLDNLSKTIDVVHEYMLTNID